MIYNLRFKTEARKEWDKLDSSIRKIFKKHLTERLNNPHNSASRLGGMENCYKIKLRQAGYRLVYQVRDEVPIVVVIAVGKREKNAVYKKAIKRI